MGSEFLSEDTKKAIFVDFSKFEKIMTVDDPDKKAQFWDA